MAEGHQVDRSWMWHPLFSEELRDTAGAFVHFQRAFDVEPDTLPKSLPIHVTADTRYKLYVNRRLVAFGPVKGDPTLWFYDEVDIAPFLQTGTNEVLVVVLRFFHGTRYAPAFPRLPQGGLRIVVPRDQEPWAGRIRSSVDWQTSIDPDTSLRIDEPEDDFLHVYERTVRTGKSSSWLWVPARLLEYQVSTGNAPPWRLMGRMIPTFEIARTHFSALHNLQSTISASAWEARLLGLPPGEPGNHELCLEPGSRHLFDLEVPRHTTGFLKLSFSRPAAPGSTMSVLYSESYEDMPRNVPYLRTKAHRCDTTRDLYGPRDIYEFEGATGSAGGSGDDAVRFGVDNQDEEVFSPFHFRTFRFLRVTIQVASGAPLKLRDVQVETVNYPLDIVASVGGTLSSDEALWTTSILTLRNCMHDCYEDCPFYEQLQYAMDMRSSMLFTYYLSGDDRLARQALTQFRNNFLPHVGLVPSRAPSHATQVIPNFALFWIAALNDHLVFYGDTAFLAPFAPVVDAVLGYFHARIGSLGLTICDMSPGTWNFVDWATEWRPYGIPPAVEASGISTYTNHLYAYALQRAASLARALGRPALADEYLTRRDDIAEATRAHCFDGKRQLFTDSLASGANLAADYSQHGQIWAVLSGTVRGVEAKLLMKRALAARGATLTGDEALHLVPASISMSFYSLRAMSMVGGPMYEDRFHDFWEPWRRQLALGVTTWQEDTVSQRSDCHAWGSAPIYEFLAEVAGIRPFGTGWRGIVFRPRLGLYRQFHAKCPFGSETVGVTGVAHVAWEPLAGGQVKVTLSFFVKSGIALLPVYVTMPGERTEVRDTGADYTWIVRAPGQEELPSVNGLHGDPLPDGLYRASTDGICIL